MPVIYNKEQDQYSEDINDVMTRPPSILVRWGTLMFLLVIILIVIMSAFIRYPDIIKTHIKINSENSPKPIISKSTGKIIEILVKNDQQVYAQQPLAYIESLGIHKDVLILYAFLQSFRKQLANGKEQMNTLQIPQTLVLGEIQPAFENFSNAYIRYRAVTNNGIYSKRTVFIKKDLENIALQKKQLESQLLLLNHEYELAKKEYTIHQKLTLAKVEAAMELQREESKLIAKKYPIQQMQSSLLLNNAAYSSKEKELIELENEINEEHIKFSQALNSLISGIEEWKTKFILSASEAGKVSFVGVLQANKIVNSGEELFYIYPAVSEGFFGEMVIPQYNMGKVRRGQEVLIKLNSYPFEEYGMITGEISTISEVPFQDSIFSSKVTFKKSIAHDLKKQINLRTGLLGQAEIITEDASILRRMYHNMAKLLGR